MSEHWIQTYTGKKFDLICPTADMICIEDIAHHLSIENRFGGASKFPYSVGYHSLLVSMIAPATLKLEGLLHDAEEAYYKDITHPWKCVLKEATTTDMWNRTVKWTENLLCEVFNLSTEQEDWEVIKNIDLRMATTERNQLLVHPPQKWKEEWEKEPYPIEILKREPKNVEQQFLDTYEKLRRDK